MSASGDGLQDVSGRYLELALDMSAQLGWYGAPMDIPHDLDSTSANDLRANAHAAWGLFNFITIMSFYSQRSMLRHPPKFPIPGHEGSIGFQTGTRTALFHRLPSYMGRTFPAACEFFLVANEITLHHLHEDWRHASSKTSLQFAESIFHRLLEWSKKEDLRLKGDASDSDHMVILHIWFHSRIIDLFRPLLAQPMKLQSFAYGECTSRDIYTASLDQLRRHVFLFPLRFECAPRSTWFGLGVLQLTSSVLADPLHPGCRFWFNTCARIWSTFAAALPLTIEVLRVFIHLAVQKGIMSPQEGEIAIRERHAAAPIGRLLTGDYVLDLSLAIENREKARMDRLVPIALDSS